MVKEYFWN